MLSMVWLIETMPPWVTPLLFLLWGGMVFALALKVYQKQKYRLTYFDILINDPVEGPKIIKAGDQAILYQDRYTISGGLVSGGILTAFLGFLTALFTGLALGNWENAAASMVQRFVPLAVALLFSLATGFMVIRVFKALIKSRQAWDGSEDVENNGPKFAFWKL